MTSRLGVRFALEALFLLAVAVAVGFAHLAAKWIVLVMVGAWLLASLVELAAAQPRLPSFAGWRRYFVRPARPAPPPQQRQEPPAAPPATGAAPDMASATPVAPPPEVAPTPQVPSEPVPAAAVAATTAARPKKPPFWQRFTRPKPAQARPVPRAEAAATSQGAPSEPAASEPLPPPPPPTRPEPEPQPEPEPEPQPEPEPEPEPVAAAASFAAPAETAREGVRRTKYALEPLEPRPRRFVMPWQRRAEKKRMGRVQPRGTGAPDARATQSTDTSDEPPEP